MSPTVLVLAGRDPTGGAGLDADRAALLELGVDCRAFATADTDQDGRRVRAVRPLPTESWKAPALQSLLSAPPDAVKTGLLAGAEQVVAAAEVVRAATRRRGVVAVVDPVLAASGGEPFLDDEGIEALLAELVPLGVHLTPNVPEAARLTGTEPGDLARPEARLEAAEALLERGAGAVFLKGGHAAEDPVRDLVLVRGEDPAWLEHPRVPGPGPHGASVHGSGCLFASTLAGARALGEGPVDACRRAAEAVVRRLS